MKDIRFDLIKSRSKDGRQVPEFVPENDESEKFFDEISCVDGWYDVNKYEIVGKTVECTKDDFIDIFNPNKQSSALHDNSAKMEDDCPHSEQESVNILAEELNKFGLNLHGNISDIDEVEETDDDSVMEGYMDDLDDGYCMNDYLLSNRHILDKYEDLSSIYDRPVGSLSKKNEEKFSRVSAASASSMFRSEGLTNLDEQLISIFREYTDRESEDFVLSAQLENQKESIIDAKSYHRPIQLDNNRFQTLWDAICNVENTSNKQTVNQDDESPRQINRDIVKKYQLQDEEKDLDQKSIDEMTDLENYYTTIEKCVASELHDTYSDNETFFPINDHLYVYSRKSGGRVCNPIIVEFSPEKTSVITKIKGKVTELSIKSSSTITNLPEYKEPSNVFEKKSKSLKSLKRDKNENQITRKERKRIMKQQKQIRRFEKKTKNVAYKREKKQIKISRNKTKNSFKGKSLSTIRRLKKNGIYIALKKNFKLIKLKSNNLYLENHYL